LFVYLAHFIYAIGITNVFEPFYRSGNAKSYNGHGKGLTLTKKIVELHGGFISIASKLNRGNAIDIRIPHLT